MSVSDRQIDDMIRVVLRPVDDLDAARVRVASRLDPEFAVSRRRDPRRRFVLAFAATLLVMLACAAVVVAKTDLIDKVLGSDAPAADRIGALRDPAGQVANPEDAIPHFEFPESVGSVDPGDGRVLLEHTVGDSTLKIAAVRTSRGELCFSKSLTPDEPGSGKSIVCGAFLPGWPITDGWTRDGDSLEFWGVTADGVRQVRFQDDDGWHDAVMGRNAYLWEADPEGFPRRVEAELVDGTRVRKDIAHLDDAYMRMKQWSDDRLTCRMKGETLDACRATAPGSPDNFVQQPEPYIVQ